MYSLLMRRSIILKCVFDEIEDYNSLYSIVIVYTLNTESRQASNGPFSWKSFHSQLYLYTRHLSASPFFNMIIQRTNITTSSNPNSPRINEVTAPRCHESKQQLIKVLSVFCRSKPPTPRSHMFVMESITKNHDYKIDVLPFSGNRSQFRVVRNCSLNNHELNILNNNNEVSMKIMMDLEKQNFTVVDCKTDRYYRFSKIRNYYYVFSQLQYDNETAMVQIIPKHFLTKADVIWLKPNNEFGKKVAELSRPLFNRYRLKYGVDNVMAWFSGNMNVNDAIVLQLCFMCIPRHINRTRF